MNTITPAIKDFFDRYARSRSVQDIDLIAAQYPDAFMTAGPNGARVARSRRFLRVSERPGIPQIARARVDRGPVPERNQNRRALSARSRAFRLALSRGVHAPQRSEGGLDVHSVH